MFSVKVTVTLVGLSWVFYGVDFINLAQGWHRVMPSWVLAAVCLQFIALGFGMSRWWVLCNYLEESNIPLKTIASGYFLGLTFNQFLPTSVGGDVVRTYAVYKEGHAGKNLIAAGIMDRLLGILMLLSLAMFTISFRPEFPFNAEIRYSLFPIVTVGVSAFLLFINDKSRTLLINFFEALNVKRKISVVKELVSIALSFGGAGKTLLMALIFSFLLQLSMVFSYMCLAQGLSIQVTLMDLVVLISIVYVAASLPISLGGLGLREGVFVALLVMLGVDKESATILSLLYLAVLWFSCIPGLLVFLGDRSLVPTREQMVIAP